MSCACVPLAATAVSQRGRAVVLLILLVVLLLLLQVSIASVLCVAHDAPGAQHVPIAIATRQTEFTTVPTGSLCEAWSTRPYHTTSATSDDGYLVRDGAEEVEEQVIHQHHDPGADDEDAYEKLVAA